MLALPSVDFGFDELRQRMADFSVDFDNFIDRRRKRLLEEKNSYAKEMAEDKGMGSPG